MAKGSVRWQGQTGTGEPLASSEEHLFIVTHWEESSSASWAWRLFVLAPTEADALRAAVRRKAWKTSGQIHITMVQDDEFIGGMDPEMTARAA